MKLTKKNHFLNIIEIARSKKEKDLQKIFNFFNKDRRERNHPLNYAKFPNNPVKRTNFYSRIYISKGEKKMQSGINKFPPLSLRKKSASNRSTNYRCKGQWQIQRLEKKKKRGEEVNLHAE